MEKKRIYVLLTLIIIISLTIRLYFAFSTAYFSDDTSYFHLRQIEYIQAHGYPEFQDPLSFSGRLFLFSPLFHYFFAVLTYFGSTWYLTKILPNLFATMLIPVIYLLAEQMTKNKQIAVFTACIAAFTPIFFVETVNSLSVKSVSIPLAFLFLYFFANIQQCKTYCIISMISLILLDHASIIIILGLVVYLFILKINFMEPKKEEKEFIFFSLLLALWFYLLLYKSALLRHGIDILWQNIPQQFIDKYYYNITIIDTIYHIGIVPLIFGLIVIYYTLFKKPVKVQHEHHEQHRKAIYPIISIIIVTTILLWLKIIEFTVGALYLSILLVILSGFGYMEFHKYLQKTKIKKLGNIIFAVVFMVFVISSVVPAIFYSHDKIEQTITTKEILFLRFLPEITPKDAIILSLVDDGHYVEYFGRRRTVADANFLQIRDAKERVDDIKTIFTTESKIAATKIMNKYNAEYIYISPTAKKLYGIDYLNYEDNDCFKLIYVGEVRLYESTCK